MPRSLPHSPQQPLRSRLLTIYDFNHLSFLIPTLSQMSSRHWRVDIPQVFSPSVFNDSHHLLDKTVLDKTHVPYYTEWHHTIAIPASAFTAASSRVYLVILIAPPLSSHSNNINVHTLHLSLHSCGNPFFSFHSPIVHSFRDIFLSWQLNHITLPTEIFQLCVPKETKSKDVFIIGLWLTSSIHPLPPTSLIALFLQL